MSIVTEYIERLNDTERPVLQHLYDTVHQLVPEVEDSFSYGIPTYKYKGKYMLAFASNKKFMSIYPGSEPIALFKKELENFKTSRGTVSFTPAQQIPDELLERIILLCRDGVEQRMKK